MQKHKKSPPPPDKNAPLVSIVIPTYNVAPYLTKCLESVFTQTEKNIEIIAIDDASMDGTWEMLQGFAKKDTRLQIARHDKNTGHPSAARNEGIEMASGKYVAFIDPDDWILAETIAAHYRVMEREHCDVGYCGFEAVDDEWQEIIYKEIWKEHLHINTGQPCFHWTEASQKFWQEFHSGACFKMYRRAFLKDTKIRFPDNQVEDLPFSFCTMIAAQRIAVLSDVYYIARRKKIYGVNRDAQKSLRKSLDMIENFRGCYQFINQYPLPYKPVEELFLFFHTYIRYALVHYVEEKDCLTYIKEMRSFLLDFITRENPEGVYFTTTQKNSFYSLLTTPLTDHIANSINPADPLATAVELSEVDHFSLRKIVVYKIRKRKDDFLKSLHAENYTHHPKWKRYLCYTRECWAHVFSASNQGVRK